MVNSPFDCHKSNRSFNSTAEMEIDLLLQDPKLLESELSQLLEFQRPMYLNDIATTFFERFEGTGSMDDLLHAITFEEKALEFMTPSNSPDTRAMILINLGNGWHARFEMTGSVDDLNRAIETKKEAVQLTSVDHPRWATILSNWGNALQTRFETTGSMDDLDLAIDTNEEVVSSTPPDYPDRAGILIHLGNALQIRFERTGSSYDLDRAIEITEEVIQLTPVDHPSRPGILCNAGNVLQLRFERTGSMDDLNLAIDRNQQAVQSTPPGHPGLGMCLTNLGNAFHLRFHRTGSLDDLDRAIKTQEQAIHSTSLHHHNRAVRLTNLGRALRSRFETIGSMADLDRVIEITDQAVQSTPVDHPFRAQIFCDSGNALQLRFMRTGSMEDLESSIARYEQGANFETAEPSARLKAAQNCADLLISHRMLKRAKGILETAVELLPQLSPRVLKRTDAQFNISPFANITARAVSLSLEDMDDPWKSLQLLELGRGILANLQLEVRSDISVLGTKHPELARQFQELRDQIDFASGTFESGVIEDQSNSTSNLSTLISNRQRLVKQFDDLLARIRCLDGFENFLKGPSETELRSLAEGGAVVVFNVSDIRSDAFLITIDGIRIVNLPLLTPDTIKSDANLFVEAIYGQGANRHNARRQIDSVLKRLWDSGVNAILSELGFTEVPSCGQPWPRVWWVGSGLLNILPIHAAGYHDSNPRQTVLDRVISSYAYTVKSLSYAREKAAKAARGSPTDKAIIIAMPTTPEQEPLEFVEEEVRRLKSLFADASIVMEDMMNPTRQKALSSLPQYSVVHFTCHGESKEDPSMSCLLLDDWQHAPLTVADLTSLNIEFAKFAFLSACHSSAGRNFRLLDESINLSSAIQLAGFPSVVGTLWEVEEHIASEVAEEVYAKMLQGVSGLNIERSAESLHEAVRALRERTSRGFVKTLPLRWAAYIHIGI